MPTKKLEKCGFVILSEAKDPEGIKFKLSQANEILAVRSLLNFELNLVWILHSASLRSE
jgi:hypothetical protein